MTLRWPSTPAPRASVAPEAVTPMELGLIALVTTAALALRAWHLGDVGLTHFDEGVYAFSGLGLADASQPLRLFPEQQKFSPPVFVALVALCNVLGIAPDRSPFVVNVAVGTLAVPATWLISRRWFGAAAGVAAATLLAFSEFHVILSRSALTDATFALTFFVAIAAALRALDRGTPGSAVLAGLATGVAWNTKYHGWFVLVVAATVIAARRLLQGERDEGFRAALRSWALMSAVAAICYVPWSWYIQSQPGSSSGWAAYFATMLRLDWLDNLRIQVAQQLYLEGPWSRASVPIALAAAQLVAWRRGATGPVWYVAPVIGAGALLVGGAGAAVALAGLALVRAWRTGMPGPGWLLAAVLVLWLVMAPIYNPYFRLIMPFTWATFVLAGVTLAGPGATGTGSSGRSAVAGLAVAAVTLVASTRLPDPSDPWRPTRALPDAAAAIDARVPAGVPVSVMGEPALAFYLHRMGHPSFQRVSLESLDRVRDVTWVVTGIYLRRAPLMRRRLEERSERFELVSRMTLSPPSDLRLLDNFPPDSARRWMVHPDSSYDLLLYRYTPAGAAPR